MLNDPLLVAALLAERRATSNAPRRGRARIRTPGAARWFRRLDVAALRRLETRVPTPSGGDALDKLRDLEIELAAMITENPVEVDRDDLDNDPVLA